MLDSYLSATFPPFLLNNIHTVGKIKITKKKNQKDFLYMIGRNDCSLEFHRSFQRGTANDSLGHTVMVFDLANFILKIFFR